MNRLLLLTPDYPPAMGGIQLLLSRLANRLADDFDVTVVARRVRGQAAGRGEQSSPVRVRSTLLTGRMGVVNANALGFASALSGSFDVVLSGHIATAPAAACIRQLRGIPFVQYLHADEVPHRLRLARFAVQRATATIAVSAHTGDIAVAAGCAPQRLRIISPGVDIPPSRSPRGNPPRPTIITVARLEDRYKGHDLMLRALPLVRASVPEVLWVVVGDGSLRNELEAEALRLGLTDHVEFTGQVSDQERDRRLGSAHVFAMPSRLPASATGGGEGFGIVYLEAGVHGLPVVAGAVGGALDAVVHDETGLLVDPTSSEDLAAALSLLLLDEARASRLGAAGERRARTFSWERMSRDVHGVLAGVIERPG